MTEPELNFKDGEVFICDDGKKYLMCLEELRIEFFEILFEGYVDRVTANQGLAAIHKMPPETDLLFDDTVYN